MNILYIHKKGKEFNYRITSNQLKFVSINAYLFAPSVNPRQTTQFDVSFVIVGNPHFLPPSAKGKYKSHIIQYITAINFHLFSHNRKLGL